MKKEHSNEHLELLKMAMRHVLNDDVTGHEEIGYALRESVFEVDGHCGEAEVLVSIGLICGSFQDKGRP